MFLKSNVLEFKAKRERIEELRGAISVKKFLRRFKVYFRSRERERERMWKSYAGHSLQRRF